jgi:hypothetical protein
MAATTRAKGDARDHQYDHHYRNDQKRSHRAPLFGFPFSMLDSTLVCCAFTT